METKRIQFRHEYKHQINKLDDCLLANRLRQLFKHDSHGTYRVSSLYFDTTNDLALQEKINGTNEREKFRIRYYNDNLDYIKLEKKSKRGSLGHKQSTILAIEQVRDIMNSKYDSIKRSKNPLLQEFYTKIQIQGLRPKTIVTYDREAFVYKPGNCRLTLDRNLRTSQSHIHFLDQEKILYNISEDITVFEVKYDNFLPDIVRMAIQTKNRHSSAYSKYAMSRMQE